jgi:hypothetical protein
MFKFLSKLGVIGLSVALMVYSTIRTYDFLSDTLPRGSEALAIFGVLAFDAALIVWLVTFMFDAEGAGQRAIAAGMVVFQLVAILAGFGGDSLVRSADNGLIAALDENTRRMVLYSTIVVIFANIAAVTFYHLLSPSNRAHMRQEGYREKIESKAHEKADKDVDMLAAQLAQEMSGATLRQLTSQYRSMIADQETRTALPAGGREEHAAQTGAPMVVMAADGVQVPALVTSKKAGRGRKRG